DYLYVRIWLGFVWPPRFSARAEKAITYHHHLSPNPIQGHHETSQVQNPNATYPKDAWQNMLGGFSEPYQHLCMRGDKTSQCEC
ncbi:MAG: hypothetical protein WBF36_14225, partial [Desulfobulbales bacterium]